MLQNSNVNKRSLSLQTCINSKLFFTSQKEVKYAEGNKVPEIIEVDLT